MSDYNLNQILYCKYCNKLCKSLNSLKQHELRCKFNKDSEYRRKILNSVGKKKQIFEKRKDNCPKRIWINNGAENKLIEEKDIINFINIGWKKGISEDYKNKISKALVGKSMGRCKDPIKERERKAKISKSMKGNTNWMYNKIRGNGKKGRFNGIFCDSTWELAYVVYHMEHNLFIKRCDIKFTYKWEGANRTYIPDFITDEGIIEIKGKFDKKSIYKHECFPDIKIIGLDLIKPYIKYVEDKYGKEYWKILYQKK